MSHSYLHKFSTKSLELVIRFCADKQLKAIFKAELERRRTGKDTLIVYTSKETKSQIICDLVSIRQNLVDQINEASTEKLMEIMQLLCNDVTKPKIYRGTKRGSKISRGSG